MCESVRVASAHLTVIAQSICKSCVCVGGNGATSGEFNCEHTVGLIIRPFQGEAFGARN